MIRKALSILFIVLSLASCSSISEMMSSGSEVPMWYPSGRNIQGTVCFVARGSGQSRAASRDDAYNILLQQVSTYLGYDVVGRYYRELGANGSVAEIALEIDNTFTSQSGSTYYYYILSFAEESVIQPMRSEARRTQVEMEAQVEALRASALEKYRNNNDVAAIRDLMDAMIISHRYGIESDGNSADALLEQATAWLSNIEIRLSRVRSSEGTATVRVVRNRGLLSPSVIAAPVKASFTVHSHADSYETFSIPFRTGEDGRFSFREYYPLMTQTGTVDFTLDIEADIDAVAQETGEDFIQSFRTLAEGIQASFDYSMTSRFAEGGILVIMDEFDENGNQLPTSWARSSFISYFRGEGIEPAVASTGDADFESAIGSLVSNYSDYEWIVWSAVGLADVPIQPEEKTVYVAEGYTILLNTRTLEIVNLDNITRSVDWGVDRDECLREVFSLYGSTVAANLTAYF